MMLSVMVMGAGAAFTDQDKIVNEEAVDMISALGIVDGYEDDSFQPEKNIERGEAAKMIAVMLNGGKDAVQDTSVSSFNDVLGSADAWANKYIEYGVSKGILAGVGGDRFAPASNVTGTQLAKMLLVSLGYDPIKEGYQNDTYWATKVNTRASSVGLFEGLGGMDVSAALTRDNAAQMIWNALNAETVVYLTSTTGPVTTGTTLLAQAFSARVDTGILTSISNYNRDTGVYTYVIEPADSSGQIIATAANIVVESTVDYSDLFAMNVTVVRDGRDALNIWAEADDVIVEAIWGDVDNYNVGDTTITIDGTQYRIDNNPNTNNLLRCAFNDYNNGNPGIREQYAFRAIDTDNGGDIDTIVLYPYTVLKVEDVDNDSFTAGAIGADDAKLFVSQNQIPTTGHWARLAGTRNFVDVQIQGDLEGAEYVMAIPAAHTAQRLDTYVVLDVQTATPSQLSDVDELVTMNGTEYDGALLTNNANTPAAGYDVLADISLKHSYNYVSVNDYLFVMDGAGVQAPLNYAVVTDRGSGTTGTTADLYQTDLLLTTGETITVNAKVMDDNDNWWPSYSAQPNVGVMYTYSVNANGNYELTRVADGTAAATTSVFDNQQVYKTGARLADEDVANNDGEPDRFKVDNGSAWFANENKTTKYFEVADDAVIFAFIDRTPADGDQRADEYVVLTGADLALLDGTNAGNGGVNWAFTGANTTSQGVPVVEMGYVYLNADPRDTSEYAYINGVSYRDGGYGVTVDVVTANGKEVLNSAKYYSQTDPVLVDLYNNLNVTGKTAAQRVVEVIYDKDGYLVGYKDVAVTSDTVEKYNGSVLEVKGYDQFLTKTDDTVFIDVSGENNLTVGDKVLYKLATGSDDLDLVVYNY